eukprot:CAMPEP_0174295998 /NCGR_PEP_ID=MMETSP0809-20121228/46533_1 /TAXON_ID=73025 ORGANISM="Eutreptiella gymnastica-like, Strain CCMP1594" /NCGR_SAMPLE_ID=MMETSP0809 /ASSEMBLY_ACC=CAM_ASM_000658 /LENGTH=43 /DNA_ID= /DNA_START= /DNA_END= /DNA_ORIENTATION=
MASTPLSGRTGFTCCLLRVKVPSSTFHMSHKAKGMGLRMGGEG